MTATNIHKTETNVSIMDACPVNLGHALLVPWGHIRQVTDLDAAALDPALINTSKMAVENG